jgi:hypothetical protein
VEVFGGIFTGDTDHTQVRQFGNAGRPGGQ